MDIYLMQHGLALDKAVDPERHLSEEGRNAVGRVARRAAELGLEPGPSLDRLAALLVTGREDQPVIAFENAGLVRLTPDPDMEQRYRVRWILSPSLVEKGEMR